MKKCMCMVLLVLVASSTGWTAAIQLKAGTPPSPYRWDNPNEWNLNRTPVFGDDVTVTYNWWWPMVIDSGTNAQARRLHISGAPSGARINMTGGTLTFGGFTNTYDDGILYLVAYAANDIGEFNMSGGQILSAKQLNIGRVGGLAGTGTGTLNLTGGSIQTESIAVGLRGRLNIGGQIYGINKTIWTTKVGAYNITGTGHMDLVGTGYTDGTGFHAWTDTLTALKNNGELIGNNGTTSVSWQYDALNDITKVYTPEPATMAILSLGSLLALRRKS